MSKSIYNFTSNLMRSYFTLQFLRVEEMRYFLTAMFVNKPFSKEDHILIKHLYRLKGFTTRSCWKNFKLRIGKSEVSRSCWENLDTGSFDKRPGAADHFAKIVIYWPFIQSGRCATYTSISIWNFKECWNSSVVSLSHCSWSLQRATHAEENNVCIRLLIYSRIV